MGTVTREADVEAAIVARLRDLPPGKMRDVLDFVEALAQGHGRASNGSPSAAGDEALIARYIDTVNVDYDHPSYARLADYGTPVWAVVGAWKTTGDVEDAAREWGVPVEYVRAALAYYGRYRRYIDAMLALNESEPHERERLRP